jgi:hypothetical protein
LEKLTHVVGFLSDDLTLSCFENALLNALD